MKEPVRHHDDLDLRDETRDPQLDRLVEALREDRYTPEDEQYWAALGQRICNELMVTPLPTRKPRAVRRLGRRIRRWLGFELPGRRPVWLTVAGVAAVGLALLAIWPKSPEELETPTPLTSLEKPAAPEVAPIPVIEPQPLTEETSQTVVALVLPDALWSQGFLSHKSYRLSDELVKSWAESDDDTEVSPYAWEDPFADTDMWTLRGLTQEDLDQIEQLLDG
ncbi:MAG: hypothetical protein JW797_12035 [Bradymonadales bacterium]|nr:hypothetical protein [Bradymonadales bacterium]